MRAAELGTDLATLAGDRVTRGALLVSEELLAAFRRSGDDLFRLATRVSAARDDVRDEIDQLVSLEARARDVLGLHRLGHLGPVIPHTHRDQDRRVRPFEAVECRADVAALAADRVTLDAPLGHEPPLARRRVAELVVVLGGED